MNILHIDSSPFTTDSVSRELSALIVSAWKTIYPSASVTRRDTGLQPPPHLSAAAMQAVRAGNTESVPPSVREEIAAIDLAIEELQHCDRLVIGAPMYNHSIPSNLKAWLDQVCQAGRTFRYTAGGPQGLIADKPVIIASSRGGIYSHGEGLQHDFQEPYLKSILGFLGLKNVHFIRAEGVNLSAADKDKAMQAAKKSIEAMCLATGA